MQLGTKIMLFGESLSNWTFFSLLMISFSFKGTKDKAYSSNKQPTKTDILQKNIFLLHF